VGEPRSRGQNRHAKQTHQRATANGYAGDDADRLTACAARETSEASASGEQLWTEEAGPENTPTGEREGLHRGQRRPGQRGRRGKRAQESRAAADRTGTPTDEREGARDARRRAEQPRTEQARQANTPTGDGERLRRGRRRPVHRVRCARNQPGKRQRCRQQRASEASRRGQNRHAHQTNQRTNAKGAKGYPGDDADRGDGATRALRAKPARRAPVRQETTRRPDEQPRKEPARQANTPTGERGALPRGRHRAV